MFSAIKSSRYIQTSLGLNLLMLVMSFVSVSLFQFFNNFTWTIFLIVGIVVIGLFFISIFSSIIYIFKSKLAHKYRYIPLVANLSMFILFPLVQQFAMFS